MKYSIIIPTYNEATSIKAMLLQFGGMQLDSVEIIVTDGSPNDKTVKAAKKAAKLWQLPITVVEQAGGPRSLNMNSGANVATGETLVFLHADTILPDNWQQQLSQALKNNVQAGAFRIKFNNPFWMYRGIAMFANTRASNLKMYHGDQTMWMTREVFDRLGGFATEPLMEDVIISQAFKKHALRTTLLDGPVITSARRIETFGWVRSTLRYFLLKTLFKLGVSPKTLVKIYETKRDARGRVDV